MKGCFYLLLIVVVVVDCLFSNHVVRISNFFFLNVSLYSALPILLISVYLAFWGILWFNGHYVDLHIMHTNPTTTFLYLCWSPLKNAISFFSTLKPVIWIGLFLSNNLLIKLLKSRIFFHLKISQLCIEPILDFKNTELCMICQHPVKTCV